MGLTTDPVEARNSPIWCAGGTGAIGPACLGDSMNARSKQVVLSLAFLVAGAAGGWYYAEYIPRVNTNDQMPAPTPNASPQPSRPDSPSPTPTTLSARRVEITNEAGQVACVLTTNDKGVPVAIIRDGTKARTIDLAWLARKAE